MCDVNSRNKEFLSRIKFLEEKKHKPEDSISILMVEYGLGEIPNIVSSTGRSDYAYYLIYYYGSSLSQEALKEAVKALWKGKDAPIQKWVLYALRDCKSQLGSLFDDLVEEAIATKQTVLCASMILDCELSEDQSTQATQVVAQCSPTTQKWKRRLLKCDKLNAYQKSLLQPEVARDLAPTGTG